MTAGRIPLALKLVWTAWLAVWAPVYWVHHGPQNFLWFCDLGNLLLGLALWLESPLLFSMQAVSLLLVQTVFTIDLLGRLMLGFHPIGGTEHVFEGHAPLGVRLLSLFHVVTPFLLVWGVRRLGYDRRAFRLQTALAWAVLAVSYFGFGPDKDLNWVWGPFDRPQTAIAPGLYFSICLVVYPLLVYWPTHLALLRCAPGVSSPAER